MTTRGRFAHPRDDSQPAYSTPVPAPHQRWSGPQVHVLGTPAEVEKLISRICHVVDIVHQSGQIRRRDVPGHVIVYLDVE